MGARHIGRQRRRGRPETTTHPGDRGHRQHRGDAVSGALDTAVLVQPVDDFPVHAGACNQRSDSRAGAVQ
jgi:hypothetical protein